MSTTFRSEWMDWQPPSKDGSVSSVSSLPGHISENEAESRSSVSSVSASPGGVGLNDSKERKKEDFSICPAHVARAREISDAYGQATDKTDTTPQMIDGHAIMEIVWQTEKAIVFRDEYGKVWRRVHAWGMTWPVEVRK